MASSGSPPDLFTLRRPGKVSELLYFTRDLPKDIDALRMQASFKGDPDYYTSYYRQSMSIRIIKLMAILAAFITLASASLLYGSGLFLERANYLGRDCYDVKPRADQRVQPSRKPDETDQSMSKPLRFAMVTCQDGGNVIPGRSFEGLADLVTPNKVSYTKRHGYQFVDASHLLDKSRPPSWSKILAVRKYLPEYDWVFWNDADSVVTNPMIALEDIIKSIVGNMEFHEMPDFIVTEDVTGVNAGMFFFRNSSWSMEFLDRWWNQTAFIRPFGQKKSGDNDALKFLIRNMPAEERKRHVRIPEMQCVFNSNLWQPSLKSGKRLVTLAKTVWQGVYSKGDFMVHLAGLNDKKTWIKKILRDIEEEEKMVIKRGRRVIQNTVIDQTTW